MRKQGKLTMLTNLENNCKNMDDLINILRKKTICLFLGAGIPRILGFPNWSEFKDGLIEVFKLKKRDNNKDDRFWGELKSKENFIEVFDVLSKVDSNLFVKEITETFNNNRLLSSEVNNNIFSPLLKLVNLNNNFIITTNVDRILEIILNFPGNVTSIYPELELKRINYIHGRIDKPDTWILTSDKYIEGYCNKQNKVGKCKEFLLKIFSEYDVLFLGCSIEEEIKRIIRDISEDNKKSYFHIEIGSNSKIIKANYSNIKYGIKTIFYGSKQEEDYSNFLPFISNIVNQV